MDRIKVRIVLTICFLFSGCLLIGNVSKADTENNYEYRVESDNTVTLTEYIGEASVVEIPDTIDGYTVAALGVECFKSNTVIESVTIPATIKSIGDYCFEKCTSLHSVSFIEDGLEVIGKKAFYESALENFTFPSTVIEVGELSFYSTEINSIHIPKSVQSWGNAVFFGSEKLSTITFDEGVKTVGESMFSACSNIKKINFPSSMETFETGAFSFCGYLDEFSLPANLKYLGKDVFYCTKIGKLYAPCKNLKLDNEAFRQATINHIYCYRYSDIYERCNTWCQVHILGPYLNAEEVTIKVGDAIQLSVNNENGTSTWKSSDDNIATVSATGQVVGVKNGTTTIIAVNDGVTMSCKITVDLLNFSPKTAIIMKGETVTLKLEGGNDVIWTSSDKKIATVDSKGVVTGKKKGTVTITAKCNGISYSSTITVKEPKVAFEKKKSKVTVGYKVKLKLQNGKDIKWCSSNKQIATVDKKGVVSGKKKGKVKITAKCNGKKYTCTVEVVENTKVLGEKAVYSTRYAYSSNAVVGLTKVTAKNGTYVVEGYVLNTTTSRISSLKQIQITMKQGRKTIAKQMFQNIPVSVQPKTCKTFVVTFNSKNVKNKKVDLRTDSIQCNWSKAFVSFSR